VWEVGGLEGSAEDGDGVVLGGDIVEGFGAAVVVVSMNVDVQCFGRGCSYYFSTHGWSLFFSGCAGVLEELALAAASFWRALISKKLAIVCVCVVSIAKVKALCSILNDAGNLTRARRVLNQNHSRSSRWNKPDRRHQRRAQGLRVLHMRMRMNTSAQLTRPSISICSRLPTFISMRIAYSSTI